MKVVACRLPDGACARVCPVPLMLAWMISGRTKTERDAFFKAHTEAGFSAAQVLSHIVDLDNHEQEIARRVRDGHSVELATQYAMALKNGGLSEDEALMLLARINVPEAVEYLITEQIDPAEKDYRTCFAPRAGRMEWDMPRAREQHRKLIRQARSKVFSILDGQRAAAVRAKDDRAIEQIDAKAQELADAPADPRIEAAQSVAELKQVWPLVLLELA